MTVHVPIYQEEHRNKISFPKKGSTELTEELSMVAGSSFRAAVQFFQKINENL